MDLPDLHPYSNAELDALRVAVLTEQERRRLIDSAPAQAAALADRYKQATAGDTTITDGASVPQDGYKPGGLYRFGTVTWRNTSKAWLPVGPAAYPLGWQQVDPAPVAASAWSGASVAYKVGDLATYGGKTYRCLQDHTTQAGWEPPSVPALWAVQG